MTPAQLAQLATDRGMPIGNAVAATLLRDRGPQAADDVAAAATLIDLASAIGSTIGRQTALRLLDEAEGDYDTASARMLLAYQERRSRAFSTQYDRLEARYYSRDARIRHALLTDHLKGRSLGYQASMLLMAAEDADLEQPDPAQYRRRLSAIVAEELLHRFPDRAEAHVHVIQEGQEGHAERVRAQISEDRLMRQELVRQLPSLALQLDALRSRRLETSASAVLAEVRRRLSHRANEGWLSNPDLYRTQVIEAAAHAA